MTDGTELILAALERLDGRIEELEGGLTKARADTIERMDRVQQALDRTLEDIALNSGALHRVERMARAVAVDGREFGDMLRMLQRKIMRLEADVEALKGGSA